MLTYPLFLIGLTAVGIPIAIHLLQLRRYRKVYFSNVEMLEELESENRRQRNLRQLLILAARILAIVFLVLAFCQPVIPDKDTQMTSGGTAVSVYIDNSYSMECGGMDGSLIEAARQKAREIAAAYSPGTQFQLMTNNASGIQFRWMSHEEFLDAVNEVEAGAVTTTLSSIARRQNEFLHTSTAGNRHAYIVSDFQRTTADLASYPPDSTVLTTFIPLGGTDVANIYIDSLSFNSPSYFRGATVQVEARVRNDGDKAVEKQPLRLYVGNRERAVTSVDIGARSSATVQMTFSIQDDSLMQGYVETTDYPITFDDRMYFSIPVTPQVPMLVISGKDENSFLKRLFQGDSLVEYRQEPYNRMDYEHLSESRFIVLDELHAIPSGLAQSLVQFVKEGGTLLVTPGKGVEASSYNQLLGALQAPQLGRWSDRQVRSRDMASNHPLYQGVFLHTGAGAKSNGDEIEMPTVTGYYALQRTSGTVSRQIIGLLDGNSYLTETPAGEGRLYLFAAPLRPEHTDFIHQALFVPTLYNMALYSTPQPHPYHLLTGTAPIPIATQPADDTPRKLINADPNARHTEFIPDIRRIASRYCLIPHGEIAEAGNYLLTPAPVEGLAFNYSRQESNLSCYSREELKQVVSDAGLTHCRIVPKAEKSMTQYIRQRSQGTPLWRWCIVLALLFLLAEILLIRLGQKKPTEA